MFEYHRGPGNPRWTTTSYQGDDMLAAVTVGASHPVVAGAIGLGAGGLAALVVAMAWNVNARQIRLAEQLARRQFLVTNGHDAAARATNGAGPAVVAEELEGANGTA